MFQSVEISCWSMLTVVSLFVVRQWLFDLILTAELNNLYVPLGNSLLVTTSMRPSDQKSWSSPERGDEFVWEKSYIDLLLRRPWNSVRGVKSFRPAFVLASLSIGGTSTFRTLKEEAPCRVMLPASSSIPWKEMTCALWSPLPPLSQNRFSNFFFTVSFS